MGPVTSRGPWRRDAADVLKRLDGLSDEGNAIYRHKRTLGHTLQNGRTAQATQMRPLARRGSPRQSPPLHRRGWKLVQASESALAVTRRPEGWPASDPGTRPPRRTGCRCPRTRKAGDVLGGVCDGEKPQAHPLPSPAVPPAVPCRPLPSAFTAGDGRTDPDSAHALSRVSESRSRGKQVTQTHTVRLRQLTRRGEMINPIFVQ